MPFQLGSGAELVSCLLYLIPGGGGTEVHPSPRINPQAILLDDRGITTVRLWEDSINLSGL